jgi:hypothetical protein
MHETTDLKVICRRSDTQRRKIAERDHQGRGYMLKKIGGLARALYILLAIVAGFVALGSMDVVLVLVVLGLVAGLAVPRDRMVLLAALVIALPFVATALGHIPTIGAHLTAVAGNLQMGAAGSLATAMAIMLYELVMEGVMGLAGGASTGTPAAASRFKKVPPSRGQRRAQARSKRRGVPSRAPSRGPCPSSNLHRSRPGFRGSSSRPRCH